MTLLTGPEVRLTAKPKVINVTFLHKQHEASVKNFGPGVRTAGVLDHIRKELREIVECKGKDPVEWADLIILTLDGMMRAGSDEHMVLNVTNYCVAQMAKEQGSARTGRKVINAQMLRRIRGVDSNVNSLKEYMKYLDMAVYAIQDDKGTNPVSWALLLISAFKGADLCGIYPQVVLDAVHAKQASNQKRQWPDWRKQDLNKAIEHVRKGAR